MSTHQTEIAPGGPSERQKLDFGYHWFWSYGPLGITATALGGGLVLLHLAGAVTLAGGIGFAGVAGGWRLPLLVVVGTIAAWAFASFLITRFMFRIGEPLPLPTDDFRPAEHGRVIDLGCGAGRTSLMVATSRPGCTIIAVDNFSADYIRDHDDAHVLRNMRIAGVEDRVTVQRADMRELPFPDRDFDGAVSSFAIDHLPDDDVRLALAEARRVVRVGGQFLLWVIVPNVWLAIAFPPVIVHGLRRARFWRRELTAAGFRVDRSGTSRGAAPWVIPEALDFLVRTKHKYPHEDVVSHKFALADINSAFENSEWAREGSTTKVNRAVITM